MQKTHTSKHAEPGAPAYLRDLSEADRRTYHRIPEEVYYVENDLFSEDGTEQRLFGQEAMQINMPRWTTFSSDPIEDMPRKRKSSLKGQEEAELFLRYNYARYRLAKLVKAQAKRKSPARARQMVLWQKRAMRCRADLTSANMALVMAMAKRTRIPNVEFGELISEGNMALLRSIEKFDVSRGFKFSTYACRAILKSFNRLATKTGRYRQYFPTEYDPDLERSDYDERRHEFQRRDSVESLREILSKNHAKLTKTERTIVMERFAIGSEGKGRTLAEVGKMVGLTNERVRQIQNHALGKLRGALDDHYLVA